MPQTTVDEAIRRQYLCLLGLHRWALVPQGVRCLDCAGLRPTGSSLSPPAMLSTAAPLPFPRRQHTLRRVAAQAAHRPRWRPVARR